MLQMLPQVTDMAIDRKTDHAVNMDAGIHYFPETAVQVMARVKRILFGLFAFLMHGVQSLLVLLQESSAWTVKNDQRNWKDKSRGSKEEEQLLEPVHRSEKVLDPETTRTDLPRFQSSSPSNDTITTVTSIPTCPKIKKKRTGPIQSC